MYLCIPLFVSCKGKEGYFDLVLPRLDWGREDNTVFPGKCNPVVGCGKQGKFLRKVRCGAEHTKKQEADFTLPCI